MYIKLNMYAYMYLFVGPVAGARAGDRFKDQAGDLRD